jgi:hypothetical protein
MSHTHQHDSSGQVQKKQELLNEVLRGKYEYGRQSFDFSNLQMGDDVFIQLIPKLSSYPTPVTELIVSFNLLSSKAFEILNSLPFPYLRKLDLTGNEFKDEGLSIVSICNTLSSLEVLELSYNAITDQGIKALTNSSNFPHLKELNIRRNEITDEGIRLLAESELGKQLEMVWLDYNLTTNLTPLRSLFKNTD